ncbi:histone-lysine N-methyltransferase SETMAR [Trichonephila clavipes]|nr:histone-lysine N-methyltransferase SETMAR [Trichonephila clavipes]
MNLHVVLLYLVGSGHNSLQNEEHTERPRSAVIPDNVSAIRKMFMDDNHCTYQMIQKELNFGSTAIYKIIHEELHMKKVVCCWVSHNLSTRKRSVPKSIRKSLKLLNNGGHRIISKIVTGIKRTSRFLTFQHVKKANYGSLKMIQR